MCAKILTPCPILHSSKIVILKVINCNWNATIKYRREEEPIKIKWKRTIRFLKKFQTEKKRKSVWDANKFYIFVECYFGSFPVKWGRRTTFPQKLKKITFFYVQNIWNEMKIVWSLYRKLVEWPYAKKFLWLLIIFWFLKLTL